MPCGPGPNTPCAQRRAALEAAAKALNVAETVRQLALGAAEMVGLKAKENAGPTDGSDLVQGEYTPQQTPDAVNAPGMVQY